MYRLILLSLILTGCSYQHTYALKDLEGVKTNKTGVVVLSINNKPYGVSTPTLSLSIRKNNGSHFTNISKYSNSAKELSYFNDNFVEFLEFPAGEYEIYTWSLFFNHGIVDWNEHSKSHLSIPFTVEPGKINYLGEISLVNYKYIFNNAKKRDMDIVYESLPELKNIQVITHKLSCVKNC